MERIADEADVPPTRISFTNTLALMREEIGRMGATFSLLGPSPNEFRTCAATSNAWCCPSAEQNASSRARSKSR